jgi:NTE family protein
VTRVGLVLGAGGVTGHAFHAGVLDAIASTTGWDPRDASHIVGTSAGSIVAALLRGGLVSRPRAFSAIASPMLLARLSFRPWRARLGTLAAAALPPGRIAGDHIVTGIGRLFGERWSERPLWICAVSLHSGRLTVFGREGAPGVTVGRAVQASCAIPSYFRPVEIGGERYVDGGVHSPTNADVLAGRGLDFVVVSSPMSAVRGSRTIDYPVRALTRAVLGWEVVKLRRSGTRVITFQPTPAVRAAMGLNALDPRRAVGVVDAARAEATRYLGRTDVRESLAALAG